MEVMNEIMELTRKQKAPRLRRWCSYKEDAAAGFYRNAELIDNCKLITEGYRRQDDGQEATGFKAMLRESEQQRRQQTDDDM